MRRQSRWQSEERESPQSRARTAAASLLRVNLIVVLPVTLLLYTVAPGHTLERFWRLGAIVFFVSNANFLFLVAFYNLVWRRLGMRGLLSYVLLALILLPLLAALSTAVSVAVLKLVSPFDIPMTELLAINSILVVVYGLAVYVLRDYGRRITGMTADLKDAADRHAATELELDEMKLYALQVFLKPHFLFNSLNAIASLIHHDSDKAEKMTLGLARVLRRILDIRGRSIIPLDQEMAIVSEYLSIEQIRVGERLSYSIDIPAEVMSTEVPAMVVQPLAENAIQHGVKQRRDPGFIHICARRVDGKCIIEVKDNGPGVSTHRGTGQAMILLHDRLAKLYGSGNYELTLQRDPAKGETIASLAVPLKEKEAVSAA
ncbi:MAG TPA: histidine kinase [Thermoanaerobaculia bacterium]